MRPSWSALDAGYGLPKGSFKLLGTQQRQAEALSALRRFWEGSDRGELMAMLEEAWGERVPTVEEGNEAVARLGIDINALSDRIQNTIANRREPPAVSAATFGRADAIEREP